MSLTLKFGNDVLGAVESLQAKRIGEAPDTRVEWKLVLHLESATPGDLESTLQALRDRQSSDDDVKLLHGSTEVRALLKTDARSGPTLTAVEEHDSNPGAPHNARRVVLAFAATLQDNGSPVQSHEYRVRLLERAGDASLLVTTGEAILRKGETPADHEDTLLPALGGGYRRVSRDVIRDVRVPSLKYVTEDEQVFAPLPGGVDDGHYVATESVEDDKAIRITAGFFVGASALARALELRPGDDRLLGSRVSQNPFTRRVDFEFREWLEGESTLASSESITFVTTRRIVDHPMLDVQLPAYRQQVGAAQTEVIQEGSAVGRDRHASPPVPRFPGDVIERLVQYSVPHPELPPNRRWVTTWRYVMRRRGRIGATTPEAS